MEQLSSNYKEVRKKNKRSVAKVGDDTVGLVITEREIQWKVDRELANHSLSSTASQGTSNIPFLILQISSPLSYCHPPFYQSPVYQPRFR